MSIPDGNPSSSYDQSSSWMNSFPPTRVDKNKVEESDEDLFTVPDMEASLPSDSAKATESEAQQNNNGSSVATGKRRRGRNPADREYRRLKRLLRNRVSAQQARERKKVYVNDLESKAKDLQDKNSKLEEKISTLVNENTMLRKVLMNTRPKVDESSESKHDQSGKG
ncbi:Basic-leucine zipper domain [Macleaya cordata]|uniref:Transcription factor HY5 n=1 Tax=Macleaya cordata TaxID=56857 RepID=A0A200R1K2_MACCD|nr:Basic-leucine zipper domain [Macleaya cordata]